MITPLEQAALRAYKRGYKAGLKGALLPDLEGARVGGVLDFFLVRRALAGWDAGCLRRLAILGEQPKPAPTRGRRFATRRHRAGHNPPWNNPRARWR